MARKPTRPARRSASRAAPAAKAPPADPRQAAIDALMRLVADGSFASIGLGDIAREAGIALADLRGIYDSKLGILRDFSRRMDQAVLGKGPPEAGEPRDRLFEIMMRRFDLLAPHRDALRGLLRSARRDLALAAALHRITRKSQAWIMGAAGVERGGIAGRLAAEGMVGLYAEVFRAFLDDEDQGLARTMAALDKGLTRGELWVGWLDRLCSFLPDIGRRVRGRMRGDDGDRASA